MRPSKFWLVVVYLCLLSTLAWSQGATTQLRGTVLDPSGANVKGAAVHLVNQANGLAFDTVSGDAGEYTFLQIPPGDYQITFSAVGFGRQVITAKLLVAQPATVNATLAVSSDSVTIEVASTSQVINTIDATIGNSIAAETITALPSEGRHVEALMSLQPGVSYISDQSNSTESRNGTVSGARSDQTNLTLDGVDNNDQILPAAFSGALRTPIDSVAEFRVVTSNANADTGRSSGGQANVVTKSGSNSLHGTLYEYNRNSFGQANEWLVKQAQLGSGEPNRPGKLIRNTYGASLGGPLKKDKLFYFGNYEGQRTNEGVPVIRTVPSMSLRAGQLKYEDVNGGVTTLSSGQIAGMDNCTSTCPWGVGPNPNVLSTFALYPAPNSNTSSDAYNLGTLTFSSPQPIILNTYVARIDFNLNDHNQIFARGTLMNDRTSSLQYYPGKPVGNSTNNSKGLAVGYTWTPLPSVVNSVRFGFTRQSYATIGIGQGAYASLRNIDLPESSSRSTKTNVPAFNVIDDYSYAKGRNTIQFGANWRHFNYNNLTDANSWDDSLANASYLTGSSISNTGGPLDPGANGYAPVSDDFSTNYDYAATALMGLMSQTTNRYNYKVSADGKTGTALGQGTPVGRDYRTNEFEWYIQDTFKPIPNLTITAGLRHTILQTPYEANGQQVQPTIDLHQWFVNRGAGALTGQSIQPDFGFAASGKAHNGKPFYPMSWKNFAPRFSLAYSPATEEGTWIHKLLGGAGKSAIRAGFGMYYDHFGQGIVSNFSRYGSFSLSTALTNPASQFGVSDSPRYTGLHSVPSGVNPVPASTFSYPQGLAPGSFAITYGLDDHLKAPYSEVVDFSLQRELKGGFTVEAAYVGRFGRHMLQQMDLAQPLNLVDPKSGMDYYTAATQLAMYSDQGRVSVPTIAYWENMFPDAKGAGTYGDGVPGASATQNIYNDFFTDDGGTNSASNLYFGPLQSRGNETNMLYFFDLGCYPGCGNSATPRFWPTQYSSLYAWSSVGSASYNAAQFTLRHPMSHGIAVDFSYTISRSIDMGSDTESNASSGENNYGVIYDAFNPSKNRSISDFDATHIMNADWVLALPYGRGRKFGNQISRPLDLAFGGWQLTGITRYSSGLPFTIYDGKGWTTNWEWESAMVQTGPIKMRKHIDKNGNMQAFDDPLGALSNMRLPYPGEAGERNKFRGDGFWGMDAGLHKTFSIKESTRFELAWETFNVTNSARFDPHSISSESTDGSQTGVYGSTYSAQQARRMQFSGRFSF